MQVRPLDFGCVFQLFTTLNSIFPFNVNPHFDGDFFSQINMKYVQLSLGLLVVVLCAAFAFMLNATDVFQMEPWRKNVLSAVFIFYGAFRGWRVYNAFKQNR